MSDATETFSGEKSYHEMLKRAQALSPALLHAVCALLLPIKTDLGRPLQESEFVIVNKPRERFAHFFSSHEPSISLMYKFLDAAFGGFTIRIGYGGDRFERQKLVADTQFVLWLQKNAVTVDDEKQLVTVAA